MSLRTYRSYAQETIPLHALLRARTRTASEAAPRFGDPITQHAQLARSFFHAMYTRLCQEDEFATCRKFNTA
eukprot:9093265-Pyramimonas_sp.AAC.1